jgi:hypothetical protein
MADIHPKMHGDETLADSSLVDSLCPFCDQRRDWELVRKTPEEFVKKCKVCHKEFTVRTPTVTPEASTPKAESSFTEKISAKGKEIVKGIKNIFQPPGTKE